MSAYALPGLFPPIETIPQSCSNDTETADTSSTAIGESSTGRNGPLHLHDNDENYKNICDKRNYGNAPADGDVNFSSQSNIGCILNSAAIAVKEAKIDPVRWIQFVTDSNPQRYAHQIGKTLRRRVSNSHIGISAGARRSGKLSQTLSDSCSGLHNKTSCSIVGSCSSDKSQQNEAIEFELSITFNGRKYTAKRTMQCIMQLRDDLIRETKRRKEWLVQKQDLSTSRRLKTSHECSKMDKFHSHLRFTKPSYFDVSHSTSDKAETKLQQDSVHSYIQIPEIPPLTSGHDRRNMLGETGFVGKGFTMLHAMVKSYVPVMESWLKKVMEIVPQDSECLMNFLWEPASVTRPTCFKSVLDSVNKVEQTTCFSNKSKSSTSLATLGSIKEMDYDSEDEDGPDEFSACGWKEKIIFEN